MAKLSGESRMDNVMEASGFQVRGQSRMGNVMEASGFQVHVIV